MVNEKVFTAVVWSDETVTLFSVEPFYYTVAHTICCFNIVLEAKKLASDPSYKQSLEFSE